MGPPVATYTYAPRYYRTRIVMRPAEQEGITGFIPIPNISKSAREPQQTRPLIAAKTCSFFKVCELSREFEFLEFFTGLRIRVGPSKFRKF
jgi:hypothetical protein